MAPRTAAHQSLLSMGFPRQEYSNGLPFPSPGDLPDPGIEPKSLALLGRFLTTQPSGKLFLTIYTSLGSYFLWCSLSSYITAGMNITQVLNPKDHAIISMGIKKEWVLFTNTTVI